jgi:hypothetical protein
VINQAKFAERLKAKFGYRWETLRAPRPPPPVMAPQLILLQFLGEDVLGGGRDVTHPGGALRPIRRGQAKPALIRCEP